MDMLDESKYTIKYFRELVEETSSTHGELALFFDVTERTMYRWYNGETKIPKAIFMVLELLLKKK
jgi:hypothetical protein